MTCKTLGNKSAFFVTEFLLYLALSGCIAVFIMQYIYGTTVRLRATTHYTDRIATIYAALDAVAHDLEQAPAVPAEWRTLDKEELVWQQGDAIIGWYVEKGILKRRVQRYDKKEQRWKRAVTHVALEDVAAITFTPHYTNNNLHAITVAITGYLALTKTYQCVRAVPVREEVVV